MSEWINWTDIPWIEEFKDLYRHCGVYKIRLADSGGFPIEIGRFLDKDKDGILQIGKSEQLGKRICDFYRAYEGDGSSHYEAERLFLIRNVTGFGRRVYNDCRIQFTCKELKDKTETEGEEERLLKCYFSKYGELPPLNYHLPDSRVSWGDLNCRQGVS